MVWRPHLNDLEDKVKDNFATNIPECIAGTLLSGDCPPLIPQHPGPWPDGMLPTINREDWGLNECRDGGFGRFNKKTGELQYRFHSTEEAPKRDVERERFAGYRSDSRANYTPIWVTKTPPHLCPACGDRSFPSHASFKSHCLLDPMHAELTKEPNKRLPEDCRDPRLFDPAGYAALTTKQRLISLLRFERNVINRLQVPIKWCGKSYATSIDPKIRAVRARMQGHLAFVKVGARAGSGTR